MKSPVLAGFGFGLGSGIVTTLGLMVGLVSGTGSKLAVLGGIITIAFADALSDAFGMHLSRKGVGEKDNKSVWVSTVSTFVFKSLFASFFVIPVLLFDLSVAVLVSVLWSVLLLTWYSHVLSNLYGLSFSKTIVEHLFLAFTVVVGSYFMGLLVKLVF